MAYIITQQPNLFFIVSGSRFSQTLKPQVIHYLYSLSKEGYGETEPNNGYALEIKRLLQVCL